MSNILRQEDLTRLHSTLHNNKDRFPDALNVVSENTDKWNDSLTENELVQLIDIVAEEQDKLDVIIQSQEMYEMIEPYVMALIALSETLEYERQIRVELKKRAEKK